MAVLILSGSHRPADAFRCVHSMPTPSAKPLTSAYAAPEGTHKSLVVFARFSDEGVADTLAPAFASRIFDPTLPGSLTHYYDMMSNGVLTIEGKTLRRRYVSIFPSIYYTAPGGGWGKHGQFSLEILESVDRDKKVDLGQYDNDGPDGIPNSGDDDGYVDFIFINTKSAPENFILRTATGIAHLGFSPDFIADDPAYNSGFIKIRGDSNPRGVGGAIQKARDFGYTVGVMAHEYGHIFGLRDLHDSSYLTDPFLPPHEDSAGVGSWGLMGAGAIGWHGNDGPAPFSPYNLERLGWIGRNNENLVEIKEDVKDLVITPLAAGGKVYKIPFSREEYFLVESRQPWASYYDRNLPQGGLLIWHVDHRAKGNMDERRKLVDVECADGLYADAGYPLGEDPDRDGGGDNLDFWAHDAEYMKRRGGNRGDATDVFDGERFTSFTPVTNPSSISNRGASTRIGITNIRSQGARMLVDITLTANVWSGLMSNVVWSGDVYVVGDIVVDAGSILTIRKGTTVRFARGDDRRGGEDPFRSELIVMGTLDIADGATFTSAESRPRPGDWYGIRVIERGTVKARRSVIEYAQYGLHGRDLLLDQYLDDLVIQNIEKDGINLALWWDDVGIFDVSIRNAGERGIYAMVGKAELRVRDCTITENAKAGIYLGDAIVRIEENTLQNNGGSDDGNIFVTQSTRGVIRNNEISGSVGLRMIGSSQVQVHDNLFRDNDIAITCFSSSPEVFRNRFLDNARVMDVSGTTMPTRVELNSMIDNDALVRNTSSFAVSVRNNWWGTVDPGEIADGMEGPVVWKPFLTVSPDTPIAFELEQNFPNPFNAGTMIRYQVPITNPVLGGKTQVSLSIYDVVGQRVRTLVSDRAFPGFYTAAWGGRDDRGRAVASGMYICRMVLGDRMKARKLLLVR